jgi:hypothetical protein
MGATCAASDAPLPTGTHLCYWNRGGSFLDGKLYVTCGTGSKAYNAQGVMTGSYDYGYAVTRVHH